MAPQDSIPLLQVGRNRAARRPDGPWLHKTAFLYYRSDEIVRPGAPTAHGSTRQHSFTTGRTKSYGPAPRRPMAPQDSIPLLQVGRNRTARRPDGPWLHKT